MPYQKTKDGSLVNEVTLGDGYPLSNDLQPLKVGGEASPIEMSTSLPDGSDSGKVEIKGKLKAKDTIIQGDLKIFSNSGNQPQYHFDTPATQNCLMEIENSGNSNTTLRLRNNQGYFDLKRQYSSTSLQFTDGTNTPLILDGNNVEFTNLTDGSITIDSFVDEDNMSSNSATKIPTQQSVKAYVDNEVAGLVDSAPAALDTLNELAAALGDDASFATTVTNSIATKVGLTGNETIAGVKTFSSAVTIHTATDAILNFKSSDDSWSYMQFLQNDGDRIAYIGTDGDQDRLIINATENGANEIDINTTTLDINANVKISGTLDMEDSNITNVGNIALDTISSDAGTSIGVTLGTDAGDDFNVGSGKLVVEGDTGNVGIGNTSPATRLHVEDTSNNHQLRLTAATNMNSGILFVDDTYADSGSIYYYHADKRMRFWTDNTEQMNILANGNVGIGNTSPNHLLHVGDDVTASFGTTPDKAIQLSSSTNDHEIAYILYAGEGSNNIRSKYYVDDATKYVGWDSTHSTGWLGYEWKIAGSQSMTLDTSGNLEISGNLKASNLYSTENIYHTDDTHTRIQMLPDRFLIYAGNVEVLDYQEDGDSTLEIDNSGVADITFGGGNVFFGGSQGSSDAKVGIGTTSPQADLHINNTSGTALYITSSDSNPTNSGSIRFAEIADGSNYYVEQKYNGNSNKLSFNSESSSDILTIMRTGKVGIGAANPKNRLQVNHTGADGNDGLMIVREDSSTADADLLGAIGFDSTDGNVPSSVLESSAFIAAYAAEGHGTGDKGADLVFGATLINDDDDTVSHEYMRILDSGNVGIGTSSPTSTLHISDASNSGVTSLSLNNRVKVRGDGVVYWGSAAAHGALSWDSGKALMYSQGTNDLQISAGGSHTDHIYIDGGGGGTDGYVGVGTNSPTTKLDVEGSVSYKHTAFTTAGPTDNVDVSDTTVLEVDTSSNNVTIGGFTGGVQGQILYIVKTDTANFIQLEHNEGGGSQDIFLTSGSDDRVVGYGGFTLYCNGTSWFSLSNPTGAADAG